MAGTAPGYFIRDLDAGEAGCIGKERMGSSFLDAGARSLALYLAFGFAAGCGRDSTQEAETPDVSPASDAEVDGAGEEPAHRERSSGAKIHNQSEKGEEIGIDARGS